jgi:hypothetical protein
MDIGVQVSAAGEAAEESIVQQIYSCARAVDSMVSKLHLNELANKIFDHLDKLTFKHESASKRWIWELLQNAQDASAKSTRKVKIEITLEDDKLHFSHNGKAFDLNDLVDLKYQTSEKKRVIEGDDASVFDTPETSGKFGTGFITTHLLSKVVQLSGIFNNKGA